MPKIGIFKIERKQNLFLGYGILNFLITNIFLQFSLLIMPTILATVLSQFINLIIGFYLYGKKVFEYRSLNNLVFKKYLFLAIILWFLNFSFIQIFFNFGVNKNITAIFLIPPLVIISYFSQKNFVFR
tara:strand:+ start:345 stop:728 length:384 start_codon:yes stop_codon:yes gene_type:complete